MNNIEADLMQNSFPYPQFYDGKLWNTVTRHSRKAMPSYLREDLPPTKFQQIRNKFRSMNKFGPPEISYFQKMIRPFAISQKKLKKGKDKSSNLIKKQKRQKQQIKSLREQMQYALITTDEKCNILVGLLDKLQETEKRRKTESKQVEPFGRRLLKAKIPRDSVRSTSKTQPCFHNTIDLVFAYRKKQCSDRLQTKRSIMSQNSDIINFGKTISFTNQSPDHTTMR